MDYSLWFFLTLMGPKLHSAIITIDDHGIIQVITILGIVVGTCTQFMWISPVRKRRKISYFSNTSVCLGHLKLLPTLANTIKWILNVSTCLAWGKTFFGVFKLFGECHLMYCFNHFVVLINVRICSERSDEHHIMNAKNNKQENLWVLSNSKI